MSLGAVQVLRDVFTPDCMADFHRRHRKEAQRHGGTRPKVHGTSVAERVIRLASQPSAFPPRLLLPAARCGAGVTITRPVSNKASYKVNLHVPLV